MPDKTSLDYILTNKLSIDIKSFKECFYEPFSYQRWFQCLENSSRSSI